MFVNLYMPLKRRGVNAKWQVFHILVMQWTYSAYSAKGGICSFGLCLRFTSLVPLQCGCKRTTSRCALALFKIRLYNLKTICFFVVDPRLDLMKWSSWNTFLKKKVVNSINKSQHLGRYPTLSVPVWALVFLFFKLWSLTGGKKALQQFINTFFTRSWNLSNCLYLSIWYWFTAEVGAFRDQKVGEPPVHTCLLWP